MAHSGRFTAPAVKATEHLCREFWRDAWADGVMTPEEEARMDECDELVLLCTAIDATEELRNAMSQREGFEAPHFERRFREAKARMLRFRQRATPVDPPPSGAPAQMKRAA